MNETISGICITPSIVVRIIAQCTLVFFNGLRKSLLSFFYHSSPPWQPHTYIISSSCMQRTVCAMNDVIVEDILDTIVAGPRAVLARAQQMKTQDRHFVC